MSMSTCHFKSSNIIFRSWCVHCDNSSVMDADNCISRNTSKKRLLESDSDLELDCCCDSDCSTPKKCLKKMNTKQTKRRQKYKSLWEKEHGAWLTNDPQNEYNAKCKLCGVIFAML